MKIRDLEKTFIQDLAVLYDYEEARNIAWLAINSVCGLTRIEYLGAKQDELSKADQILLMRYLKKLKTGMPLQYVLGETEFYGLRFKVNSSVLIPRPETEELVDWILKDIRHSKRVDHPQELMILDIGTGSGCIPIALKKNFPDARVCGIDISSAAINTATENAILNNVDVTFLEEDVFELIAKDTFKIEFSLIVSNPPYVTLAEKKLMHQNVVEFEPHGALFVQNNDPLQFYKAIALFAKKSLKKNGKLFLEINENYGKETIALLEENGFRNIDLRQDLRGRERMVRAEKIF
jgi:release factor glutamine methyltransferase